MPELVYETMQRCAEANWHVLPLCSYDHSGMSEEHKKRCRSSGKRPLLLGWPSLGVPTIAEINEWRRIYPTANIGLATGEKSGIVAIDADGEEGIALLAKLSGGDLPVTWTFTTPGGGIRYLYQIPAGFICKKWCQKVPGGGHAEVGLLGDGQQTVIPPSVHANGGTYEWIEGCAPYDGLELAEAPKWMVELMTGQQTATPEPATNEVLEAFAEKCPAFAEALHVQQTEGLDEETWYRWISLLDKGANREVALVFSRLSAKHNEHSERRISDLKSDGGMLRCMKMECKEEQIRQCFPNGVRKKKDGTILNSSGAFLQRIIKEIEGRQNEDVQGAEAQLNPEEAGFYTNKEGRITGVNGNIFSRYILGRHTLVYTPGGRYYHYQNGVYVFLSENRLKRLLRDEVNRVQKDAWTERLEDVYLAALERDAPIVKDMDSDKNYLNLENGMFDLKSFELLDHSPNYHSSIRIPIWFDSAAQCPRYDQFLEEVFEGDLERIAVSDETAGYCMTGETEAEKAFIAIGEGSNGKSVWADILRALCGRENVSTVPLKELENSFARLDLVGKTVNIVTESEIDAKGLNTEYFKGIVSGDPIRVEQKFGQAYVYDPVCKLFFCMNNLPYSKDRSHGFMRRLLLIPFTRQFTEEQADRTLKYILRSELPGIFNRALAGLKRLRESHYRFTHCKASKEAFSEYSRIIDPVRGFVEDCVNQADESVRIPNNELRRAFSAWCRENGHNQAAEINVVMLAKRMDSVLIQLRIPFKREKSGDRYIAGISLKAASNFI